MNKSYRPNEIPKLDFSKMGFEPTASQKKNQATNPEQKIIKISSPKSSARKAHPDVPKINTDDLHKKQPAPAASPTRAAGKPSAVNQPPKREVIYKNKQVFYKEISTEAQSSARGKKGPRGKFWYLDEDKPEQVPTPKEESKESMVDKVAQLQAEYVNAPYQGIHEARKSAAEDDIYKKRQNEVMEQVLIDLLSRHVISDVEQDTDPARRNPSDPASAFNTAPIRNKSRRLHDTKVSTTGAVTESKLKDRITFGARILTRDGRDALRDLFGFYFHMDSSLTVYEFRLFGKNNLKALPLIERGQYRHQNGRRKGKLYEEVDFDLGRNLTFSTHRQPRLPDSLKKNEVVTIRVCDVIGAGGSHQWEESYRDSSTSDSALEQKDRKITAKVQKAVRKSLLGRSVSVVIGLGKLFRQLDRSGDGKLSKAELAEALMNFDINLSDEDFEAVWRVVDENNDQSINYGEFLRAFIGEMNEYRKSMVRKVFRKLDPHKNGYANMLDLRKLYSAKRHPFVAQGILTQAEMEENFVKSISGIIESRNNMVSFVEFEEYYEGLSLTVQNDEDFVNILRNCWGV